MSERVNARARTTRSRRRSPRRAARGGRAGVAAATQRRSGDGRAAAPRRRRSRRRSRHARRSRPTRSRSRSRRAGCSWRSGAAAPGRRNLRAGASSRRSARVRALLLPARLGAADRRRRSAATTRRRSRPASPALTVVTHPPATRWSRATRISPIIDSRTSAAVERARASRTPARATARRSVTRSRARGGAARLSRCRAPRPLDLCAGTCLCSAPSSCTRSSATATASRRRSRGRAASSSRGSCCGSTTARPHGRVRAATHRGRRVRSDDNCARPYLAESVSRTGAQIRFTNEPKRENCKRTGRRQAAAAAGRGPRLYRFGGVHQRMVRAAPVR